MLAGRCSAGTKAVVKIRVMRAKLHLVSFVAKTDTSGVSPPSALACVDETGVGRGHLQHRLSPHMLILRTTCTGS